MASPSAELMQFFSPNELANAYGKYVESKRDKWDTDLIRVPVGFDGITHEDFSSNLSRNIQEISSAVLRGEYFFYPSREVLVPKNPSGERPLQVSRVRDTLVQKQMYKAIYERAEALFAKHGVSAVSFGYRRGVSASDAVKKISGYINKGYSWALDGDIEHFFDTLDHERLMRCVEQLVGNTSIERQLTWRFIRTPSVPYALYRQHEPTQRRKLFQSSKPISPILREIGIPQGGVISGLLANLYLYDFDVWMLNELCREFDIKYIRYADDFIVLCRVEADAQSVWDRIHQKLAEIGLTLHPIGTKTKIANIAREGLEFLGFYIAPDRIGIKRQSIAKFKQRMSESLQKLVRRGDQSDDENIATLIAYRVNPKIVGPPDDCPVCGIPIRRHS